METITIKGIESSVSSKGAPFLKVTDVNDQIYTVWKADWFQLFQIGTSIQVDISVSPDGKFKNVRGVGGSPAPVPQQQQQQQQQIPQQIVSSATVQPAPTSGIVRNDKERSIIAQCLTKCVWYGRSDATPNDVLGTYNYLIKELEKL